MNIFSLSSILVLVFPTLMALFLFFKRQKSKGTNLWGCVCLLVGVWGIAGYKFSTVTYKEAALFWWQIAHIGPIFNPVFYYHFVYVYLGLKKRFQKSILIASYVSGSVFLVLDLFFKEFFIRELIIVIRIYFI